MLSIGILSHYAPKTLEHTLATYKNAGLFELSNDIFVVIQKSNRQEQEKIVCESFGVRAICLPDNGKMASGFKAIYENALHDYILFLENDFIIGASPQETKEFIENTLYFLNTMKVDIVRGRSRKHPGEPNYAYHLRNTSPEKLINCMHLSESIYWLEDPEIVYPTKISRIQPFIGKEKWYTSSSESCNYTNNPYICSKDFFSRVVLPHIKFGGNIEDELTDIWSKSNYTCVFGPGLFTHDRTFDGHH